MNKHFIRFLVTTILCGEAMPALAGGFYIQEQSVSGLGTAFAGAVADTPDASTIYYNPAGMIGLTGAEISTGVNMISPNAKFDNTNSIVSSTPGTGGARVTLSGNDGGDPFDWAAVPNAYIAVPVSTEHKIWAGVGVSAPFGLANEYNDDFFGRYDSTENALMTINVAPSLAYGVTDWLSVGFGVDIQYADATLKNAIPSPITAGGPTLATDGEADLSGDDTTVGFNAGVIIKPDSKTRIGVHYRQGISHTLEGELVTRVPSDVPGVGGNIIRTGGKAELDLPNIASAGISYQATDKLKVLFGVNWYEWSNFNDIPVQLDSGTFTQTFQNYEDTWGFAAGARYQLNDRLMLKAGAQFDPTPTVDHFRSTRIPDGDRTWVSGGASYDINDKWSLDVAATYVDIGEEDVDIEHRVAIGAASTTYDIDATTEGDVGIFSGALRYKFTMPY